MKVRSDYWDNLKGILILLVVIAHFMQRNDISRVLYDAIYMFHMPLFIFVSGVFHKNTNIKERILGLVLIGIVYNASLILVDNVILKMDQDFYLFRATKIPWFVFTLAICAAVTYVVRECNELVILIISLFLGIIACYDANLMQYMVLSKTVGWFFFYYLGVIVRRGDIETLTKRTSVRVLEGGGMLLVFLSIVIFGRNSALNISQVSFLDGVQATYPSMDVKWALVKLLYYVGVIVISMAVISLAPHKKIVVLTELGRKTMPIYFWHIIVRSIVFRTGIQNYFYSTYLGNIIWALVSAAIAVILTMKPFEFPTKYILDGLHVLSTEKDK